MVMDVDPGLGKLARDDFVNQRGGQDPAEFLAWAYARRSYAIASNDLRAVLDLYDGAKGLQVFEMERSKFFADLGSRWQGELLDVRSEVEVVEMDPEPSSPKTARVYERLSLRWRPRPRERSPEVRKLREASPEKFGLGKAPAKEITSVLGVRHEITLIRDAQSWRIAKDSYEEPDLFESSPDLTPGSWSAEWTGRRTNRDLRTNHDARATEIVLPDPAEVVALASYQYRYWDAISYARARCGSYNPQYCNFNPCGGDCANFVSQCFRAGNHVPDWGRRWYTYSGGCGVCGTSAPNAGTDPWANNWQLRNWVINSGRGEMRWSIDGLGFGDIVNYDRYGSGYHHVTITVDPNYDLVCSHNPDRCNVPWNLGGGYYRYAYTWLFDWYNA